MKILNLVVVLGIVFGWNISANAGSEIAAIPLKRAAL